MHLSATVSGGTVPFIGGLTFQVGTGAVMVANCTAGLGTETCTATYPIVSLASGSYVIYASFVGDANYYAANATCALTIAPPGFTAPATAVGSTSQMQTATLVFGQQTTLSSTLSEAIQLLTISATGKDFNFVSGSTLPTACAAGATYQPDQSCTVTYSFKPLTPGVRSGAVVLGASDGSIAATAYLSGTGAGPQGVFMQGVAGSSLGSLGSIYDIVEDGKGNLYVNTGASIFRFAPGVPTPTPLFNGASSGGLGIDGAGNLYIKLNNGLAKLVEAQGAPVTVASNPCFIDIGITVEASGISTSPARTATIASSSSRRVP